MVGVPPQRAPMLVLGFLPIDSSILAGIPVQLMHLEIHSSNKRNLAVEGLLTSLLVVPMPMFLQLTFLFLISSPFFQYFQLANRSSLLQIISALIGEGNIHLRNSKSLLFISSDIMALPQMINPNISSRDIKFLDHSYPRIHSSGYHCEITSRTNFSHAG